MTPDLSSDEEGAEQEGRRYINGMGEKIITEVR